MRAKAAGVQHAIRAAQDALAGERVEQVIVAGSRLVRAGKNRIDDAEPRVRADTLIRDALTRHDRAKARG